MIAHVSRWVLPVDKPTMDDGAVLVENGRIRAVGPADKILANFPGTVVDHGQGAILPGLVNCHTHLEFSALAGQVQPQKRWEDWLTAALAGFAALPSEEIESGIGRGITQAWETGTALLGEVSNRGLSWPALKQARLAYHLFYECLGFDLLNLGDLREAFPFFALPELEDTPYVSAAAHAPYSVSPALFRAVREWNAAGCRPQMVHVSESRAELAFLAHGDGFCRDLLKRRGRWVPNFQPPRQSPPAYLASLGFLGPGTLAVHGVWLNAPDRRLLADSRTWLILCPRANAFTGAGQAPVPELIAAAVPLALGTDSLAGNWDLNLFGEMRWLREKFPDYPGDLWLRLGTGRGARALGREADFGSLSPGKQAALGFIPLTGKPDFWTDLYHSGAAGEFRWICESGWGEGQGPEVPPLPPSPPPNPHK
jgi:cytosine/adenosine deaminase-related metal-dependent hydrolase